MNWTIPKISINGTDVQFQKSNHNNKSVDDSFVENNNQNLYDWSRLRRRSVASAREILNVHAANNNIMTFDNLSSSMNKNNLFSFLNRSVEVLDVDKDKSVDSNTNFFNNRSQLSVFLARPLHNCVSKEILERTHPTERLRRTPTFLRDLNTADKPQRAPSPPINVYGPPEEFIHHQSTFDNFALYDKFRC